MLAQLADLVTFAIMGIAHEANPLIVAMGPMAAVLAKTALIYALVFGRMAFRRGWLLVSSVAILAGSLGAISNVATML